MNNKCNNCAKFLACNRKECKKITFLKAGILDKPQNKHKTEAEENKICNGENKK